MIRSQNGITAPTALLLVAVVVFFVILGFKCVPVYSEYFGVKRIVSQLAKEGVNASPAEIKDLFNRKASIEYVTSVKADDLEITKSSGAVAIAVEYDKPVRLFGDDDGNHGDLVFHFRIEEGEQAGSESLE